MFEAASDNSFKDTYTENQRADSQAFSLPTISNKPGSRGEVNIHKQIPKQEKLVLPNIKESDSTPNNQQFEGEGKEVMAKNKTTFALQVEQKLKKVLGGMQSNPVEKQVEQESYDSDNFDFQQQINKNKEIIKQYKIKKQNQGNYVQPDKEIKPTQKGNKPNKNRNQSLYERRAKDYKDQSIQNKYLSKRKQTIKNQAIRESSKEIKSRNQIMLAKQKPAPIRRSKSKVANNKILNKKDSMKNLQEINRSVNLFDGIQNYLENPRNKRKQHKQQLVGLSLLKAKRDIEDKIKAINEKLGQSNNNEQEDSLSNGHKNSLSSLRTNEKLEKLEKQWRRIQFKEKQIMYQDSNFDKELDRVGTLQQKTSLSLEKYLQQQKILLELEFHRKALGYRKQASSSS